MTPSRRRSLGLIRLWLALLLVTLIPVGVHAHHPPMPSNYPQSLELELATLLNRLKSSEEDLGLLLRLSELYLDLGDDLYAKDDQRRRAYEEGALLAHRALQRHETNADAHFLYAANLGNAKRLKGAGSAARVVKEIIRHVERAIALDPLHAPALQFMGGLLAELPWFLGRDRKAAEDYLERAIAADGNYTNARVLLAKLYLKQHRINEARAQLEAVIHAETPHYPYAWRHTIRPEADRLLKQL